MASQNVHAHAVFSFDYPPNDGGIARLCAEIAAESQRRGNEVQVLSQHHPDDSASAADCPSGYETRVTPRRPQREWQAWQALRRGFRNRVTICGLWYPEGLLATLAGVRPRVILAHGAELMPPRARWRRGLWQRLQRQVLTAADLVVTNSHYTGRLVETVAPGSRVAPVPLGVDHHRFAPGGPGDSRAAKQKFGVENKLVITSVSRIHAFKGHEVVLRALAALPEAQRQQLVYLVAGQGSYLLQLQAQAGALGLDNIVRWLGFVPEANLPDLYRAADLFALCTREQPAFQNVEGFGLVFLEAQACATPVVGTRTGGIPDAIKEGAGGWLIDQDDTVALTHLFKQLVEAPETFQQAGLAARQRVEQEATWGHYLDRFALALRQAGIQF